MTDLAGQAHADLYKTLRTELIFRVARRLNLNDLIDVVSNLFMPRGLTTNFSLSRFWMQR
jgi:hypothetical protein